MNAEHAKKVKQVVGETVPDHVRSMVEAVEKMQLASGKVNGLMKHEIILMIAVYDAVCAAAKEGVTSNETDQTKRGPGRPRKE